MREIDYRQRKAIILRTTKGDFSCTRLVLSLPLGVLKTGTVHFHPPLPERKLRAIHNIGLSTQQKLFMRFERTFWPQHVPYFMLLKEQSDRRLFTFVNLTAIVKKPLLMSFYYSEGSLRLLFLPPLLPLLLLSPLPEYRHDPVAAEAEAQEQLKAIFKVLLSLPFQLSSSSPHPPPHPPQAQYQPPIKMFSTMWALDPDTFGSFSILPPGSSLADCDALAAPIEQRVFFVGEATEGARYGTADGAYTSGIRAAQEIAKEILGRPKL